MRVIPYIVCQSLTSISASVWSGVVNIAAGPQNGKPRYSLMKHVSVWDPIITVGMCGDVAERGTAHM